MSELKLFTYDNIRGYGFHMPRPATPEEIKDAHGKCATCKHYDEVDGECSNSNSWHFGCEIEDPATDYCNHHEPKEE